MPAIASCIRERGADCDENEDDGKKPRAKEVIEEGALTMMVEDCLADVARGGE